MNQALPQEVLVLRDVAFAMIDTEFTSWEGSMERDWSLPWEHRELVQVGVVLMRAVPDVSEDAGSWGIDIVGRHSLLVRPRVNPALSAYFTALTGIDDDLLAARGMEVDEALEQLRDILAPCGDIMCYGRDGDVIDETCRLSALPPPDYLGRFRDIRPLLRRLVPSHPPPYSGDFPALLGLSNTYTAHDALGDANALAISLDRLVQRRKLRLQVAVDHGADRPDTVAGGAS